MNNDTPMYEAIPGHRKHDKRGAIMDVCPNCCTDDDGQPVVLDNGSVGRARFVACSHDTEDTSSPNWLAPIWACNNCGIGIPRRPRKTKLEVAYARIRAKRAGVTS